MTPDLLLERNALDDHRTCSGRRTWGQSAPAQDVRSKVLLIRGRATRGNIPFFSKSLDFYWRLFLAGAGNFGKSC